MSGRRKPLFFSKNVVRMTSILTLILHSHEVGYAVLMGYEEWPTSKELATLNFRTNHGSDVEEETEPDKISIENRCMYEFTSAESMVAFIDKFGGHRKIVEAFRQYRREYPKNMKLLKEIAEKFISHKKLCNIAKDNSIDIKTLKSREAKILHDIAFSIIYGDDFINRIE